MVTLTRELATTDHFVIYVRRMLIIVSVCSLTETDMIAWARPSRKHSSNLIRVNPDIEHVQPISVRNWNRHLISEDPVCMAAC